MILIILITCVFSLIVFFGDDESLMKDRIKTTAQCFAIVFALMLVALFFRVAMLGLPMP